MHYPSEITCYKSIGKGSIDNGYLDNLDNESSNKYEKILKIKKNLIDIFIYL
jgi:hypothetical protein